MKYYFLESRSVKGDPIAEKFTVPSSYHQFYLGKQLPAPRKPLRMTVSKSAAQLPDLLQGPFIYIVASERLRDIFLELETPNVQTVPVGVFAGSTSLAQYHFIQVLNNVDAIDWSSSDLDSYPEDKYGIVKVRKLLLDRRAVGNREVFRLEGLTTDLVVGESFHRRVEDMNITGMQFTLVEDFTFS